MLLANMSVAQLIGLAFPDNALLRRHPTPQDRQLGELEASAQKLVRPYQQQSSSDSAKTLLSWQALWMA